MDRKTLVTLDQSAIEEGRKLIDALDGSDLQVAAAFWYYMDGPETYRLVIATAYYDKYGPHKTYEKIEEVIRNSQRSIDLRWDAVSVVSLDSELYKGLNQTAPVGNGMKGKRLTQSVVDGIYIEDAYLYRVS